ncbi:hypothetical protein EDM59_12575 [Brevibacillus nitrificans]|uniref:DUF1871 family protein n=1 Tax=Brevibacillus nitrificans TaxID=651560 RepID=A0A3M8DC95_9BACL|nr:hypothetical protein [Brevibacillus nitrificans]RNB85239.1 hypothetical protein EDM59_12575 [Brevibacillus nitrificans]
MNGAMKKRYSQDLKHIRMLMNDWDPMGFIEMGAPEDEYDSYSIKVVSLLHSSTGNSELKGYLEDYLSGLFVNPSSIPVDKFINKVLVWFKDR